MVEIIRAETAGFCMGVDLALQKLDRIVEKYKGTKRIYTLGPIIHNPQVLQKYSRLGVLQAEQIRDIQEESCVVVRAHGVPKYVLQEMKGKNILVEDATCPKVKKAQKLIRKQSLNGSRLLLFGERDHPEVKGLLSYAPRQAHAFESLSELQQLDLDQRTHYFLAAQTTQDRQEFQAISQYLKNLLNSNLPVFDTICDTTRQRQQEAINISSEVQIMIIVGGYNSGNTRRLAQVVKGRGTKCIHIEQPQELPLQSIRGMSKIGLTAGASTPKDIIDQVQQEIENFLE